MLDPEVRVNDGALKLRVLEVELLEILRVVVLDGVNLLALFSFREELFRHFLVPVLRANLRRLRLDDVGLVSHEWPDSLNCDHFMLDQSCSEQD